MAEGYLKLMVLNNLNKLPQTGYSLINGLAFDTGRKPSTGTIYPLLSSLLEDRMISLEEDGRKKIYSLTRKGKNHLQKILLKKEDSVIDHIRIVNGMNESLCCSTPKIKEIKEKWKENSDIITKNIKDWEVLRNLAIDLVTSPNYNKKKSKIRKILKETAEKLEGVRDGTI